MPHKCKLLNEEIYSDAERTANLEWFMTQWGFLQVPSGQKFMGLSDKLNIPNASIKYEAHGEQEVWTVDFLNQVFIDSHS